MDIRQNENLDAALKEAKWRFETHGLRASDRSYEYGVLVVKNALVVSGGGLFFLPAMVGLAAEINIEYAVHSGLFFGICVLLTLVANYLIHLNWMMLEQSLEHIYEIERILIRKSHSVAYATDENSLLKAQNSLDRTSWWVPVLFYIPHLLAALFVISFAAAAFNLYNAFFFEGAKP